MKGASSSDNAGWVVFDRLPHPLCVIDDEGRVRLVNRAWKRALENVGFPGALCKLGEDYFAACESFARDESMAALASSIRDVVTGERPTGGAEVRVEHRGDERWIEVSASAFALGNERGALVQHFDVTEERRAERFHRLAVTVGHRATGAGTLEELTTVMVPTVCEVLGWPLAIEWRARREGLLRIERAWFGRQPVPNLALADHECPPRVAMKARLERQGSFESSVSADEGAGIAQLMRDSTWSGPAFSVFRDDGGNIASVVVFYLREGERPDAHTLELVESLVGNAKPEAQAATAPRGRPASGTFPAIPDAVGAAALSEATVLLLGENGTGKTRAARRLHDVSSRSHGPFLDLNCAGLGPALLESELFGHEKGAFTGATSHKRGLLELAAGGTVLLDEIGELDPIVQAKLLKVLETRRFRRLGGTAEHRVDVRFVAATNLDLRREVAAGRFRQDLFYRLAVVEIRLPSLRERPGEIPVIAEQLVRDIAGTGSPRRLTVGAVHALLRYSWPGNVRELRNVLERAMLGPGREITADDVGRALPEALRVGAPSAPLVPLLEHERRHIEAVLGETNFNMRRAASILGIARSTLYARVQKYGIAVRDEREPKRGAQ